MSNLQARTKSEPEVVWRPIPGTSQELALDTRCDHTLYHGARGPGKTVTQLMRFRRRVGLGYGSFWRGVIFDREFKNLGDLVAQSKRFFNAFGDGAKFHESGQDYKWVWPTGEELLLRHIKKESQYDDYHGHEYPFIGWNELTKYPDETLYDKLMSCNRTSFTPEIHTPHRKANPNEARAIKGSDGLWRVYLTENGQPLPDIPLQVFSTTNPNGPGHAWVKARFIDVALAGQVVITDVTVFDPRTQQDVTIQRTQVAIFGSYRENIYLTPQYVARLEAIKDPNLRRAWLLGDWDAAGGGIFDDLWDRDVHIVPRFAIPKEWTVDRSLDWGSSTPFAIGWWAEANGEDVVLPDGSVFTPAKGSLIQIAEYYGATDLSKNIGLLLSPTALAQEVKEREIQLMKQGWVGAQPAPGPADNQIRNVTDTETETLEKRMAKKGVRWTVSDKSRGSRVIGATLMRERLEAAKTGEGPAIYFMINCQASIKQIPNLPRDADDADDVDKEAPLDHTWDMTRFRILRNPKKYTKKLNVSFF